MEGSPVDEMQDDFDQAALEKKEKAPLCVFLSAAHYLLLFLTPPPRLPPSPTRASRRALHLAQIFVLLSSSLQSHHSNVLTYSKTPLAPPPSRQPSCLCALRAIMHLFFLFFYLYIFDLGSHRLVCERRQHDGLLHGVHHQLPQLLQDALQHRLLADLGKQSQAVGGWGGVIEG